MEALRLSAVVVHWGDPQPLRDLLRRWPDNPRVELVVVDNSSGEDGSRLPDSLPLLPERAQWLRPGRNLGFAAGANAGVAEARAPWLLILNSDVVPQPGALDRLIEGFEAHPEAAGLAPRLVSPDGSGQWRWQLRSLPTPGRLLLHALFLASGEGPRREPPAGAVVEQPAAAALALHRSVFRDMGGFDPRFYPAWFEDVDLARRLQEAGHRILYHPASVFDHALGSSVSDLGYGLFLWIYGKNLHRYLKKHHGWIWTVSARWLQPLAALARIFLLPLRRPRRASSRRQAATGLLAAALGALTGWRRPAAWAERFRGSP